MTIQTHAKLCKRMRKQEIIDAILLEMRKNPKITNLQLALNLKLHRNTISKYRSFIRENYYITSEEIVNKIDSRLQEDLDTMTHKNILSYRSQLVPKKAEITSEHTERILNIQVSAKLMKNESTNPEVKDRLRTA